MVPRDVDYSKVNRVLVIRQHDMLGDFLLATPVFRALRSRFPHAHIGVLVRDYLEDAILHNPHVDEILVLQKSGNQWNISRIWKLLKRLFRKWDLTIVLNTVSHSFSSDILATLSGGRYILGSAQPLLHGCSRNFFYNLLAPSPSYVMHQTQRNLETVRYLGADTDDLSEEMHLCEFELAVPLTRLQECGVNRHHVVVGMHVGAGKMKNRWPVSRFAQLAQLVHEQWNAQVMLFWGREEEDLSREFCRSIGFTPLKVPPRSIRELAAFFTHCTAVVCNDTGVMHVCAAVGVPLVAIFGPTDPSEWKPVGNPFVAIQGIDRTVESVSADQAFTELKSLILRTKGDSLLFVAEPKTKK